MVKRAVLIFVILLIFATFVIAEANDRETLKVGQSLEVGGKNITVLGINTEDDNEQVRVCVNNMENIINHEGNVNGAYLSVEDISRVDVELDISVYYNVKCDINCRNDECGSLGDVCITNGDCNDKDIYTKDLCLGQPRKCLHEEVGNRPSVNEPVIEDVSEEVIPIQEEIFVPEEVPSNICFYDDNCEDNNECTIDKCSNGDCLHFNIKDCEKTTGNVVLSKLQGGLGLTTGYIFIAIAILLAIFIIKRNVRR